MVYRCLEALQKAYHNAGFKSGIIVGAIATSLVFVPIIVSINGRDGNCFYICSSDFSAGGDSDDDSGGGDAGTDVVVRRNPGCPGLRSNATAECKAKIELPEAVEGNRSHSLSLCHEECEQHQDCHFVVFQRFEKCQLFGNCSKIEDGGEDVVVERDSCPDVFCNAPQRCIGGIVGVKKTTSYIACLHEGRLAKSDFVSFNHWTNECRLLDSCKRLVSVSGGENWQSGFPACLDLEGLQLEGRPDWAGGSLLKQIKGGEK